MNKIRYFFSCYLIKFALGFCCLFNYNLLVNAAEWSEIDKRGKLIIGVKNNFRPLAYINSEGNLEGFEIDIAKRLAAELLGDAQAVEFIPLDNSQRLPMVMDDQVDLAIASVTVTNSRQRIVDFSPDYYFNRIGIVTQIKNLSLFEAVKIAVLKNSLTVEEIKVNLPEAKLIGVDSYQEAFSVLENGEAEGFAGDMTILSGWIQEYPQYFLLPQRFSGYPLAIVMPKGLQYQELRDKVSVAIKQWKEEGWLEERAKFWGLANED